MLDPVAEPLADQIAAYSAKRSTVSRFSQPPSSSSACGRSQWNSVAIGWMPALEQLVDEPVVEVEALGLAGPDPSGWIRGHAIENR